MVVKNIQCLKQTKTGKGLNRLEQNKMERMKQLVKKLDAASYAYYQTDYEIMTNKEYDALYDELVELESKTGIILSNSPTQKVGHTVLSSLQKVQHEYPMLSLDKTKEPTKLAVFLGDNAGILSWKLDGLMIVLTYKNGELTQAVTRGSGVVGEDITHNAMFFKNIPRKITFMGELMVRGEAVISYSDFNKINEQLPPGEAYKNPRNLCSGTVRQLNSEVSAKRSVNYFVFNLVKGEGMPEFTLKSEGLAWLAELGFDTVEFKKVTAQTVEEAMRNYEKRVALHDFATDGLVLTYDDIAYSNSLGATSKFPRDSIAFKWADDVAETKITEVQWNTSRTGLINPVAVFEDVELEGTTVNRASLHNVSVLRNLAIGIGDVVTVYKANMIIPQISENLTRSNTLEIPKKCPVCSYDTEIVKNIEGEALYCTNPNCKAQLIRSLTHFTSRDAMNVEGLSVNTLEKFVEKGFIGDYTDIYELEKHKQDICEMEGFGEKSCANLLAAVEASKNTNLVRFIYALGINQVGLSNAKLLCKHFNYDLTAIMNADIPDFIVIEGFGDVISEAVYKYFRNEKNLALIEKARGFLTFAEPPKPAQPEAVDDAIDGKRGISGLTFVITGDVEHYKNRNELKDFIESKGGKTTGSVTKKTSYLINNDVNSTSSKNTTAKTLGIPIISEQEFIEMFVE